MFLTRSHAKEGSVFTCNICNWVLFSVKHNTYLIIHFNNYSTRSDRVMSIHYRKKAPTYDLIILYGAIFVTVNTICIHLYWQWFVNIYLKTALSSNYHWLTWVYVYNPYNIAACYMSYYCTSLNENTLSEGKKLTISLLVSGKLKIIILNPGTP